MNNLAAITYTYTTTTTNGTGTLSVGQFFAIWGATIVFAVILLVIPMWKIFVKADRPGWAAIVPIYNTWVLFEIVGYPGWWAVLAFVPIVNFFAAVMALVASFKLAKLFGKSDVFAVMTVIFPFICIPILGYGKATLQGTPGTPVADTPYPTVQAATQAVPQQSVAPAQPPQAVPTPQDPNQPQPPTTPTAG